MAARWPALHFLWKGVREDFGLRISSAAMPAIRNPKSAI